LNSTGRLSAYSEASAALDDHTTWSMQMDTT
jgi:hypothetical protein